MMRFLTTRKGERKMIKRLLKKEGKKKLSSSNKVNVFIERNPFINRNEISYFKGEEHFLE